MTSRATSGLGPASICSPRHRMPFNLRSMDFKDDVVGNLWQGPTSGWYMMIPMAGGQLL